MKAAIPDAGWHDIAGRWPAIESVIETCARRLGPDHHGDAPTWRRALDALPDIAPARYELGDTVTIGDGSEISAADRSALTGALRALRPWRKGPFDFFGTHIDSEWRSDWKWRRIAPHIGKLTGLRALDVGAGNGYFGWRMLEAGAASVLAVDPTILFCMQHLAVRKFLHGPGLENVLLPLRLEEMPAGPGFDIVFSLGVIYHRQDPVEHLRKLRSHLLPGGRVVVESLVVDDAFGAELVPADRYAKMRNVYVVPAVSTLQRWLEDAGFSDPRIVDVTKTSIAEQRRTPWMPFESLAAALDPADGSRTIEGLPAPVRACVIAGRC